jgi:hypothetical protein
VLLQARNSTTFTHRPRTVNSRYDRGPLVLGLGWPLRWVTPRELQPNRAAPSPRPAVVTAGVRPELPSLALPGTS